MLAVVYKYNDMGFVSREDTNQPVHLASLIRILLFMGPLSFLHADSEDSLLDS